MNEVDEQKVMEALLAAVAVILIFVVLPLIAIWKVLL